MYPQLCFVPTPEQPNNTIHPQPTNQPTTIRHTSRVTTQNHMHKLLVLWIRIGIFLAVMCRIQISNSRQLFILQKQDIFFFSILTNDLKCL